MKVTVWVCGQCGAKHWPQVVAAAKKCPSCGDALDNGKLETEEQDG